MSWHKHIADKGGHVWWIKIKIVVGMVAVSWLVHSCIAWL